MQMGQNITLGVLDLTAMPELLDSVNGLSLALQGGEQPVVARAWTYA